jgi:hypothetical protein
MNSKKNSNTHQVGWIQHVLVQEDNSNEEAWVYGWMMKTDSRKTMG